MAADVEPIALVFVGPADAADQAGIGFKHHAGLAVPGELIGPGEPCGTAPDDHRVECRDDCLGARIIHPGPAMRQHTGANRLCIGRIHAHPRLHVREECGSLATLNSTARQA